MNMYLNKCLTLVQYCTSVRHLFNVHLFMRSTLILLPF